MSRRDLLLMIFLGAPMILGGCYEMTASEKRLLKKRMQFMRKDRVARENLIKKVRNGYEGFPPPEKINPTRRK